MLAASASRKDIPVQLRAIGNVEAFSTVSIKSLVPGEVTGVFFKEGQDVKKGALLFTIDPHPIEADLRRAEGVLAKDTVEATNAEVDAGRYSDLFKKGMVSRQQLDQSVTAAASLKETIRADRAAIESIKVQLGYTKIYSPIAGKTGNLNVTRGNIVKANETPYLVVINQIQPVYVTFSAPEMFLSEIQALMSKGKLKVAARISGDTGAPPEGYLSFIDNAVDITTGNVKLKATFENKSDKKLWPGQFVDVVLTLSTKLGATVVPAQAVQNGQKGQYVFVVKPDKTVENRPVVLGLTKDNDAVIEKGINPGETVVTDGQVRLVPGTKVDIKTSL
ncbi:MAG TPA: efflux RND transporter periplasmic adaptor subunit [Nitrospirota bacterium]